MSPSRFFEFDVEEVAPRTLVYRLRGRLRGWPQCFEFQEDVHNRVAGGGASVILVMDGVDRIDSTGVGILAAIYVSVQHAEGTLVLAERSPVVDTVLGRLSFLQHVEHADSLEGALARLEAKATTA